jgi:hypothetical protein
MTCGGIIVLAECAQAAGSKHFNQAQLDATWENTTMLLRLIGRENARAQGYLDQLLQLKEQARPAYLCSFPLLFSLAKPHRVRLTTHMQQCVTQEKHREWLPADRRLVSVMLMMEEA